ncbi:hypothetical protein Pmani_025240 [Petrolisthes manimaculis]|uniref:Uncharacterized protein n=1 Tax=Petrolisthes manimaculis TaxID=1843537 RepID=A0AAE1P7N2_9EUCA|nr:hypothetical protein Pmani_025240 [Petrolisthes manimaculis]
MTEEVCKAREILWQDMTELEVEVERQRKEAGFGSVRGRMQRNIIIGGNVLDMRVPLKNVIVLDKRKCV